MGCGNSKAAPAQPASGTLLRETGQAGADPQKPAPEENALPLRTIEVNLKKTADNGKLGLQGDKAKDCWVVTNVGDGLVKLWNEQNPDLIVEKGDKIMACNGVRGTGEIIVDVMKKGTDLQLTVAKINAPPEKSASPENNDVVDTPSPTHPEASVQDIPEGGDQEVNDIRSRLADGLDRAVESGDLAAAITEPTPVKATDSAPLTMEEQAIPEMDIADNNERKQDGWMCCSGPRGCK